MTRKVLVSLDEELLRAVDRVAADEGLSRSAYLSRLAREAVGGTLGPGRDPAARAALKRLDRIFRSAQRVQEDVVAGFRRDRDSR